jgi:hypothetical protein
LNKIISLLIIGILHVTFLGCSCIDALIPRPTITVDAVFVYELQYEERYVIPKNIKCEKYYDAQCSERGNFRAYREVNIEKS